MIRFNLLPRGPNATGHAWTLSAKGLPYFRSTLQASPETGIRDLVVMRAKSGSCKVGVVRRAY